MYFYTIQIFRDENGDVTNRKCISRSLSPLLRRGLECVAVPHDEEIDPAYVSVEEVEGQLVVSENTTLKNAEADIALRMRRIQFGQRLVAIMSIRNDAKNLTGAQIVQLVQDFASINTAWLNGSIATSRALVDAITPDGTILTEDDKTAILAEIDANLASLGYEV